MKIRYFDIQYINLSDMSDALCKELLKVADKVREAENSPWNVKLTLREELHDECVNAAAKRFSDRDFGIGLMYKGKVIEKYTSNVDNDSKKYNIETLQQNLF